MSHESKRSKAFCIVALRALPKGTSRDEVRKMYKKIKHGQNNTYKDVVTAQQRLQQKVDLDMKIESLFDIINDPKKHTLLSYAKKYLADLISSNENKQLVAEIEAAFEFERGALDPVKKVKALKSPTVSPNYNQKYRYRQKNSRKKMKKEKKEGNHVKSHTLIGIHKVPKYDVSPQPRTPSMDSVLFPKRTLTPFKIYKRPKDDNTLKSQTTPAYRDTVPISNSLDDEKSDSKNTRNLTNHVVYDEADSTQNKFSNDFGFGVYMEYWPNGYKNSVIPKYRTLREELTQNRYAPITEEQYDDLHRQCKNIIRSGSKWGAEHIGAANRRCGIAAGMKMTISHAICVKLYTDFDRVQREFKRHCRRMHKNEPIESVLERNAEIAHWCRLLKESIMFWGETMGAKQMVYSGMNARLLFHSLYQRFECPLSTTTSKLVADRFTKDRKGIRLSLKRASPVTRYLNVAPFSCHGNEKELLFMGSSLKITNIQVEMKSFKLEVAALSMLEQIIKGRFIDGNDKVRHFLLDFLKKFTVVSVTDALKSNELLLNQNGKQSLFRLNNFLEDEQYDSDAILTDANMEDGNIRKYIDSAMDWNEVIGAIKTASEKVEKAMAFFMRKEYVWLLFANFLQELHSMKENGDLWMNRSELKEPTLREIQHVLLRKRLIQREDVRWMKEFEWSISGLEYIFLCTAISPDHISSPICEYVVSSRFHVSFKFRMYRQHSTEIRQCAIFLELEKMPQQLRYMWVEMDMKCVGVCDDGERVLFRQWFQPRMLKRVGQMHGYQCFDSTLLEKLSSLKWMFSIKIFKTKWAMECQWELKDDDYTSLCNLMPSMFIYSPPIQDKISFRFRMYRQHSQHIHQCAIFVEIMEVPPQYEGVEIEMDMKCIQIKRTSERVIFQQWLQPRTVTESGEIFGFTCFESSVLSRGMSLKWMFGIKVFGKQIDETQPKQSFIMIPTDHSFIVDTGKSEEADQDSTELLDVDVPTEEPDDCRYSDDESVSGFAFSSAGTSMIYSPYSIDFE